jgi:hypothetical protein
MRRSEHRENGDIIGSTVSRFGLLSFAYFSHHKLLDIVIGRAKADDCYVKVHIPVEVQGPLDSPNDPSRFVAERSAPEKRKKQSVASMAHRIQDRRTNRCLIGCLENEPCECLP